MPKPQELVGPNARLVACLDEWRAFRGMTHPEFARWLGRPVSEWAHARAHRRPVPKAMIRLARQYAAEDGPLWVARINSAIAEDAVARLS